MNKKLFLVALCSVGFTQAQGEWTVNSVLSDLTSGTSNAALIGLYYTHQFLAPTPSGQCTSTEHNWNSSVTCLRLLQVADWLIVKAGADPYREIPWSGGKAFCNVAVGRLNHENKNGVYQKFCADHCKAAIFFKTVEELVKK